MIPSAKLFHKDYRNFPPEKMKELEETLSRLMVLLDANTGKHATFHDDMFVWFRNHFFTNDRRFDAACGSLSVLLRARLWRLYTLCWGCAQGIRHPGAIVDIGTYDGRALEVVLRYQTVVPQVYAYDLFDNVPEEARKEGHGPKLFESVVDRLAPFNVKVHAGDVRQTLNTLPECIAFCQIDLNDAEAEAHAFPLVYDRMTSGGVVIFDDYGFSRYRKSALAHQVFLEDKEQILELPTGQGLLIKS